MTRLLARSCLVAAALALSACQSARTPSHRFDTHITSADYKLFQLTFPRPSYTVQLQQSRREERRRSTPELTEQRIAATLEDIFEQNGYCRQGYVILGRYAGETSNRVRGECRERASAEDRSTYSNTIERW